MELLKFDKNVDVIAQLGDQPNLENGLSAQELKAKFDQAANLIKEYLNAQVAPAVNEKLPAAELPTAIDAALAQAKASGAFDGVSVTHEWNGTALKVTSASGTSSADLRGAKGDKGDTGDKGDKGDTGRSGNDGADGRSVYYCSSTDVFAGSPHNYSTPMSSITGVADSAVNSGDIIINAAGTLGVVSSVQNGVVTVYAVASIKGDDGATGDKGEPGKDGTPGAPGKDGAQGPKGDKGDTGAKGDKGEKGDKGDPFTYDDFTPAQLAALKGEKGDNGASGLGVYYSTETFSGVEIGFSRNFTIDYISYSGHALQLNDMILTPDGLLWKIDFIDSISLGVVRAQCVSNLRGAADSQGYSIYYSGEVIPVAPDAGAIYSLLISDILLSDRPLTGSDLIITADGYLWKVDLIAGEYVQALYVGNIRGKTGDRGYSVYYSNEVPVSPSVGQSKMLKFADILLSDTLLQSGDLVITADGYLWKLKGIGEEILTGVIYVSALCIGCMKVDGKDGKDGKDGINGTGIHYSDYEHTDSPTIDISQITSYERTPVAGDMFIDKKGDLFTIDYIHDSTVYAHKLISLRGNSDAPGVPGVGIKAITIEEVGTVLISFTIYRHAGVSDPVTYQAEEGMTWAQWCESEYNTGNYHVEDGYIWCGEECVDLPDNETSVHSTDVIAADGEYIWEH